MRYILLLLATAAFAQEVRNPHTTAADEAAGAKIFRSHCAECHGVKGEGGRGPNLTTGVYYHGSSDQDLFRNITDGIPGTAMPGVFFSADQVWQIVAHVRALARVSSGTPVSGDPARGARLLREKGCLGCHLVAGEGGVNGPDLSVIGSQRSAAHLKEAILEPNAKVLRADWSAKITMKNGTSYRGRLMNEDTHLVQILDASKGLLALQKIDMRSFDIDKSSAMPSYKDKLSAAETDDLVSYLMSLKRPRRAE